MMITQSELKELLDYDPNTGLFVWKFSPRFSAGSIAGNKIPRGYIHICINYKQYQAHRLAWLYVFGDWPKNGIDHINRIPSDNRIANLRDVTQSENMKNQKMHFNNKSGVCGVYWHKSRGKWQAQINVSGKCIALGRYKYLEDAVLVRKAAEKKYLFHENHGRV